MLPKGQPVGAAAKAMGVDGLTVISTGLDPAAAVATAAAPALVPAATPALG